MNLENMEFDFTKTVLHKVFLHLLDGLFNYY